MRREITKKEALKQEENPYSTKDAQSLTAML